MRRELTLLLTVALTVFAALVIGCGTGKHSNMARLLAVLTGGLSPCEHVYERCF